MKNAALWTSVLALCAGAAFATGDTLFEEVQPGAYSDMLSQATIAYDKHDYDRAFALNRRTACGGDKTSQAIVGRMYVLGQGTPRDEITGYAWIKLAAEFSYADSAITEIANRCKEVESGARNVDRILTGTLLPEMSGEFLSRMAMNAAVTRVHVDISDGGGFTYEIS